MYKPIVHQMRAGAPDKIQIWTDGSYILKKHDKTNLVDYDKEDLLLMANDGEFILPADEGDIRHANKLYDSNAKFDQSWIILPHNNIGDGYCQVIPYDQYVPKNSEIYKNLEENTGIIYQPFQEFEIEEFENNWDDWETPRAFKTTTGSGSRGVILLDPDRVHLGGKYVDVLRLDSMKKFIEFAKSENCKIIVQELVPNDPRLKKVNVDFVIREGKLLGYKWTRTDPTAVFTNWNFGWTVNTNYTNDVMQKIADYLISRGIYNAMMNFEAFTDMQSIMYLLEFNWRYSNSTFEDQAAKIDILGHYLYNKPFEFPIGEKKFSRYWQCAYYDDMKDYHCGK